MTTGPPERNAPRAGVEADGDTPEVRLFKLFSRFGPAYVRWLRSHAECVGLSFPRLRLLHALHVRGPSIMSDFKEELSVTGRSITSLVDALEHDGLVRRRPHPTDRRATLVELTDIGLGSIAEFEQHATAGARLFSALDERDQGELLRIMELLLETLDRERLGTDVPGTGPVAGSTL